MTAQALIMLSKLKKVQIHETGTFYVDNDNLFLCTVKDGEHSPVVRISIQKQEHSFYSIMEYLVKQGLVRVETPFYIYGVTHEGWCIWQTAASRFLMFLFSSILVPIVVSAITTLVALWINGAFKG